ncbi:uncharacterized protein LOC132197246 [Neocloeon triangulifer]|uniref:uncharacterized protein LOC132197246 n=1 Tax=Neocloeon triangulifer TaxID=2078957 RepID=UPI00286F559A|nr:uncharacterized protein LOC132197246 [Neocloeon triangulifer]
MFRSSFLFFALFVLVTSVSGYRKCNLHTLAAENSLDCGHVMSRPWHQPGSVARCSCARRCSRDVTNTFFCNQDGKWYAMPNRETNFDCLSCQYADCFLPSDRFYECKTNGGVLRGEEAFCRCKSNKRFYMLKCAAEGHWTHSSRFPSCGGPQISQQN